MIKLLSQKGSLLLYFQLHHPLLTWSSPTTLIYYANLSRSTRFTSQPMRRLAIISGNAIEGCIGIWVMSVLGILSNWFEVAAEPEESETPSSNLNACYQP